MKVLHVITGLGQGGAERQLASLASASPSEFAVFSMKQPGPMLNEVLASAVPVFSGGARRRTSPSWFLNLRKAIHEVRPDIVMGWMYHGNLAATLTRRLGHTGPILWNVRHSLDNINQERVGTRCVIYAGAWLARSPVKIVYNSAIAAEQHGHLGFPREKEIILPNGFDLSRFKPDPAVSDARRAQLGIPPNVLLLGVVGRAHPMKNHLGCLKALKQLIYEGLSVRCVMVGEGVAEPDGPVAGAVREAGLEAAVSLLPPTQYPESLYPALDLLVMPSLWGEGFPNVVGEAMACSVPALVTDVGDAASVVGNTGFVSESGDPSVLAYRAREAIAHGRESLADMGALARQRMVERYGLASVAARYRAVCYEAVGRVDVGI